jgi:hypothetical protein
MANVYGDLIDRWISGWNCQDNSIGIIRVGKGYGSVRHCVVNASMSMPVSEGELEQMKFCCK